MSERSDCCGAETCDHCYDCGSYDLRPKCDKCDEFCERKPAEPREENYAGVEIDKMIIDEYHDHKQDHPGRWPSVWWLFEEERIDENAWQIPCMSEDLRSLRDYILQLEARVKELEGK